MTERRDITLEYVARGVIELGEVQEVGDVLGGRRRVIPITGGRFEGPLLDAEILDVGADWQVVAADGTATIDTRYSARTASGDLLFISTQGFRFGPPEVIERLARGETVPPDEYSFRLTARIEASAPDLAWVNRTVFIATAERFEATVRYDLYAVR